MPSSYLSGILGLLWLGHTLFFAFGNTNSIATIDIGAAYTGTTRPFSLLSLFPFIIVAYQESSQVLPRTTR